MNWIDGVIVAIIAAFALVGLMQGFIYSVFKIASFFVSIYIAIKLHPMVTEILMKTNMFFSIKSSIQENLFMKHEETLGGMGTNTELMDKIPLPQFIKDLVFSNGNIVEAMNLSDTVDIISTELAAFIISIISLIALFIGIRLALMLFKFFLQGIAKLPVFKQLDKAGGLLLGALEGLLTVYVLFAIVMLFSSSTKVSFIFEAMGDSLLANFFYEKNFIIDMIF